MISYKPNLSADIGKITALITNHDCTHDHQTLLDLVYVLYSITYKALTSRILVTAAVVSENYATMSTTSTSSNSITTAVSSLLDLLVGDVPQLLAWMASTHFTTIKLASVLLAATGVGRTDMCLANIDSERLSIDHLAGT
jgi:glucose-6-phosphate dehydrogenase assembly protein OpcA